MKMSLGKAMSKVRDSIENDKPIDKKAIEIILEFACEQLDKMWDSPPMGGFRDDWD